MASASRVWCHQARPKEVKVGDLNALFDRLPRLDSDDVDAFERDIAESDAVLATDRDPWA